ncbi:MAG: hypothetical protein KY457_04720 [Actinobacteria bacterium]|nr:hypothetical protein [Actinomycetota bacterium]
MTVLLAHAGEGATWQALLTVIAVGMLVLFVLALVGRLRLDAPGDLTLPVAAVAVIASLAPIAGDPVSDAAPWAVPAGAVLLVSLVVAATTSRQLTVRSPLTIATVVLAVVASLALAPLLVDAWYPDDPALARSAPA